MFDRKTMMIVLGATSALGAPRHMGRTRYPAGWARNGRESVYRPHAESREAERRVRQMVRNKQRRMERYPAGVNCGLSRRGKLVDHGQ